MPSLAIFLSHPSWQRRMGVGGQSPRSTIFALREVLLFRVLPWPQPQEL